jgi:hypothetical protein
LAVLLLALVCLLGKVMDLLRESVWACGEDCLGADFVLLSDVLLSLGSVLGLIALGVLYGKSSFCACNALLISYARRLGFLDRWASLMRRDVAVSFVLWFCAVGAHFQASGIFSSPSDSSFDSTRAIFKAATFMLTSGILMGLTLCVLHVCRALTCMIDAFCAQFMDLADFEQAVREWNVLQAVLRKACGAIEYCFLALQTTVVSAMLLNGVGVALWKGDDAVRSGLVLVPGAILVAAVIWLCFSAAAVSEKCTRVPALVNSLSFGDDLDTDRMYVVDYIKHSAAGFYVCEVCLNSVMALKFLYISGVVGVGITTKLVASE